MGIGKKVKATDVWTKVIESQIETGVPYLCSKDNANNKTNHENIGVIKQSNLCNEIYQFTDEKTTAICTLSSMVLKNFVKDGEFDFQLLYQETRKVVRALNKVVDINNYSTAKGEKGGREQRAIAIGTQGLADVFYLMDYEFTSIEAKQLNKDIFVNRGVRLSRDTIPNFPESQLSADCYDMEEEAQKKINKIYSEMESELKKLRNKVKKERNTNHLTAILRARQEIELVKVPLFLEMIEEGLENGMSVAVFCNFTETIHALAERLNTQCIVNGETKYAKARQQNIDDFQNDKERVILINIAAGGAGLSLHDVTGKYPRLAIIAPSYSAVLMRQSTGRVWRDSAKSKSVQKIVFVAKTVEEQVCESVNKKLENMDLLNDGDLKYDETSNSN